MFNDQAQIVLDHLLPRRKIPGMHQSRQMPLLLSGEQGIAADLVEIHLGDVDVHLVRETLTLRRRLPLSKGEVRRNGIVFFFR